MKIFNHDRENQNQEILFFFFLFLNPKIQNLQKNKNRKVAVLESILELSRKRPFMFYQENLKDICTTFTNIDKTWRNGEKIPIDNAVSNKFVRFHQPLHVPEFCMECRVSGIDTSLNIKIQLRKQWNILVNKVNRNDKSYFFCFC